ncbi:MAG: FAD-dependent monooxygenase [Pseudomonadota bacterium]
MIARYDVVVLGGGLVGSAMALTLAGQGLHVALIDRMTAEIRADPEFDGRAYAIAPGSANLLGALGLWPGLETLAEPVRKIVVADQTAGPVAPAGLHFDPAETDQLQLGWILEDRFLRGALLRALNDAGVEQIAPADVEAVTPGPAHAEISLHGRGSIYGSVVVACDGRRSAIARAQGVQYLSWAYGQTGLVSAIEHTKPHHGIAHQSFFAGGPFAVLPLQGNRSAIVWSDRDQAAKAIAAKRDDAYMRQIALRIDGRLGNLTLAGRRWTYPLGLAIAQSYAQDRFVVAGDAAHGVHPIAGQGLNMGLRDVAALTEVLVEAGRRGEDLGALTVLKRYEEWRRFDATAMALGMDGLNRLFSTSSGPVQILRNLGLRLTGGAGFARRGFMGLASGVSAEAPALLRGQSI